MQHHESLPVELGRHRSLHIIQQNVRHGVFGLFQALSSSSGVIRVQEVAAGEQPLLEISSDSNAPETVQNTNDDAKNLQTVLITVSQSRNMQIVLKVPKGSRLGRLHIESEDFKVDFEIRLNNNSSGSGSAATMSVESDLFSSREIVVSTKSGAVSGLIPSEDLLNVATISGRVGIMLLPLHDNAADAKRSELRIKTVSGSVTVNKDVDAKSANAWLHLPSGSCDFAIQTVSGSVYALTGMPKIAAYRSISGSLKLQVLQPSDYGRCDLSTTNVSGSQSITVLASENARFTLPFRSDKPRTSGDDKADKFPAATDKDAAYAVARSAADAKAAEAEDLPPAYTPSAQEETVVSEAPSDNPKAAGGDGGFFSSHKSTSGSIKIEYPLSWHGMVDARTVSSSITIEGGDVQVEKKPGYVHAVKGAPGNFTDIKNTSGSVKVLFA